LKHRVLRGWRRPAAAIATAVFIGAPLALVVLLPAQFAHPDSVATSRDPAIAIRALKADLIERLKSAPRVVVLGGSRATRFDPAYIRARTGASAFNASVFGARPEDAWAFANLLHSRFPNAHFRFVWVIHADYFGGENPARVLLEDPLLSQYFPPTFVARWSQRLNVLPKNFPLIAQAQDMLIVANGQTVHSPMDVRALTEPLARRVKATVDTSLRAYASLPAQLQPERRTYFEKTLALMKKHGDKAVIVMAPMQPAYLAAVRAHGWSVRHALVVNFVRSMQARFHFDFLDLSRSVSIGAPPNGFYDGVHLRTSTSNLVIDKIIKVYPQVL
jgi:hypothetical protein